MSDLVTEDDLARARSDPAFRQQLLAQNLDRLLEALNKMRKANDTKPGFRAPDPGRRRSGGQARRPAAAERPQFGPAGGLKQAVPQACFVCA